MHPDWKNEIERLEYVKQEINNEFKQRIAKAGMYKNEMRAINKQMWEELGPLSGLSTVDAAVTFTQHINSLKQNLAETVENRKVIERFEQQMNSPYFARIDFKEDDWELESFYIGIYGFRKDDTGDILIYDWRAPVSSMFYDYEPGRASYISPSGNIEGDLVLKRQYRIEKGEMKLMFDSNIAIEDDILQDILAGSADNRMKTIVSTIQREQNRAIRNENKRILAVQGPAGSGKTSIALHRAAYLLYRYRDTIKAENILLFTPNELFSKYISTVLPELGEDDIPGRTLVGLVQEILGEKFDKYETYAEMMEWQLLNKFSANALSRLEAIKYKSSGEFADVIERFAEYFEDKIIKFNDIYYKDVVFASAKELEDLFHVSYKHMKISKRLSRIEMQVLMRIKEYRKQLEHEKEKELAESSEYVDESEVKALSRLAARKELEPIYQRVKEMRSIDIVELYRMLFENMEAFSACGGILSDAACRDTAEAIKKGILYYEDQVPVLYLMELLGLIDPDSNIKHVIIDEAQDYSVAAYKLFSRLYTGCGVTLLGDLSQNINPTGGIGNIKLAGEILDSKNLDYIELDKTYRSTIEIMEFAGRILPSGGKPFGRHGKTPLIMEANSIDEVYSQVVSGIKQIEEEGFNTVAVICRTLQECRKVYEEIKNEVNVELIAKSDDEIMADIVVIPSYLAKGLEFDAVMVLVLSENEYAEGEEQLLYTICTRALHRLDICAIKGASLIEKLGKKASEG